ncbi:restriction endonuclease subunit S [Sphingomonas aquatica]|uniref:restriction endonuclease subunit S n=1 Tax=Sphingomonas aquatica TaxID=1763824 RepID=UPI00301E52AA
MSAWPIKALDEIFDIARGGSPRPIDKFITDDPDGVNWIMIGDASAGSKYIRATKKRIIPAGVSRSRTVKPGDFLLTNSMSFGKPYILDTHGCIHDGWLVLSPKIDNVDADYFYHLLGSPTVYSEFERLAAGATVKNLNIDLVKSVSVALPPLDEQKRIAAILDQADELRRKRQRAIDRLNQLGQAIFHEMFSDPEQGHDNVRLEDVASQIDYGLTASAKEDGDGPKFLRITDIQDGKVDWATVPVCDATTKQITDNELHAGDIVFARTGATTGKSFLIETCPDNAVFASYLIRVRPSKAVRPEYLFGFFQTTLYWNQIQSMAQGAAQPGVNSTKLKELVLPLPSIELQESFCDACRLVKNQLVPMYDEVAAYGRLFSSLQHRAFQGEL